MSDPYANLRKPGGLHSRQPLERIVRHGLPPASMPGHEWFTDQQVADVAAFVESLLRETSKETS